jgi:ubiquinone/menaquinone biosynthesis C-methylase UbiE
MQNSKEIIQRTFDEAASQFDEIGTPFFRYFGKELADFSGAGRTDHILDIACGKGATTLPLLEKIAESGRLYAIDLSSKMVEECKKQILAKNARNIAFRVMDAENLEFPDASIDKVVCGFGLFFLTDIEKGMSEIRRVLKPGGSLVFSSWNKEYRLKWLDELIAKYLPEISKEVKDDYKLNDDDFSTIRGIEKILELCGFRKQKIEIRNLDCYYSDEEEWIRSRWQTAFRMYFERLPENDYKSFKSEIIKNLQTYQIGGKLRITSSAFLTKASK